MKLLPFLGALAAAVGLALLVMPTVLAESRTPAEATAHARDELTNCRAQQRPECPTPTPTPPPAPTWTPSPSATSTPQPTDTPAQPTTTATPEPCWLTDELGEVVFDQDGAPVACPAEDAREAPVDTAEPTLEPAPTDAPTQAPRVAQPPAPIAPAPREVVVVQTVVVVVTAEPIATPPRTIGPAVVVVEPAVTSTPRPSTPTSQPSMTASPATVAVMIPSRVPTAATSGGAVRELPTVSDRGWLYGSVLVCLVLATLAVLWLARRGRRRYAP